MEKAYITGATGAIGMALVGTLIRNKVNTTVFLRKDSARNGQLEKSNSPFLEIKYVSLDELGGYECESDFLQDGKGKAVFFHFGWQGTIGAGRNDVTLQESNVEYTLAALRLAKRLGCNKFVGAGSQAEYGRVSGTLTEDTQMNPETEYGKAKLKAENESRKLAKELGLGHIWFRILSVYGPFDGPYTMVSSCINKLLSGEPVELTKGEQIWDYIYSEDAAKAMYMAADSLEASKTSVYCLGGGSGRPLKEYVEEIARAAGAPLSLLHFGSIPYSDKQVMYLVADINRLKNDTGFVCDYNFADGIRKTIDWVKQSEEGRKIGN